MRRLLLLILPALFALQTWSDTRATKLDILVHLHQDGSATITETWSIHVDGNGECYVRMDHMDNMAMHGLRAGIYEEDGTVTEYEYIEPWDPNASRAEKAGHCGVNPLGPNSWERNWALGTQDGDHKYVVVYELENVVRHYSDGEGLHHCFMQLDVPVDEFVLCIKGDDNQPWFKDVKAWTFRNDSELFIRDTFIYMKSRSQLRPRGMLLVTAWFPPGTLTPAFTVKPDEELNGTFQQLVDEALEGSDYLQREPKRPSDDSDEPLIPLWLWIVFGLGLASYPVAYRAFGKDPIGTTIVFLGGGFFIFPLIALAWLICWICRKCSILKFKFKVFISKGDLRGWHREIPLNGDIILAYRVHRYFHGDSFFDTRGIENRFPEPIIQALMLRLLIWKCIEFTTNKHDDTVIKVLKKPSEANIAFDPAAYDLYLVLKDSADKEGVVGRTMLGWYIDVNSKSVDDLQNKIFKRSEYPPTYEQARQVIGLRRFLIDNTLLDERRLTEASLWDELLVYATLFGVAEKVIEELRTTCPKLFDIGTSVVAFVGATDFSRDISKGFSKSISQVYSSNHTGSYSSGGGGYSSSSGGGSHYSGGGGGGFR